MKFPELPTKEQVQKFVLAHKKDIAAATALSFFGLTATMAAADPENFHKMASTILNMLDLNALPDSVRIIGLGTMATATAKAFMDEGKRFYAFVRPSVIDPAAENLIKSEDGVGERRLSLGSQA